jgi:hypothetical protein
MIYCPKNGGKHNNQEFLNPHIATPTSVQWFNVPKSYYIKLHRHQNKYTPIGSTESKPTNPIPSEVDILNFLNLSSYTGNKNATDIFVSRLGTFALRVTNKIKVDAALSRLTSSQEKWSNFCSDYDELVTNKLMNTPRDESGALEGYIEFINTILVGGNVLGVGLYQAVFDSQGNITTWVQL